MAARTPLYDRHVAAGARIVEFGGYDMPLLYTSIREEHVAVRTRAGLFDLSHMGEVRFTGDLAQEAVQGLVTNDVSSLTPGAALYSVMCNDAGGIVDDVVVYRDGGYLVVVNAACRFKDLAWMQSHLEGARLEDASDATALLAVQGPAAVGIVRRAAESVVEAVAPFHFIETVVAGVPAIVSRTGYTGEDGFELYVDSGDAPALWDALLAAGADDGLVPCGLGARDTLRLEAGLRLYGQDMDDSTDPYSCGLGWTVKLDKGEFVGAAALRGIDRKRPPHRFIGLRLDGRAIPRHGNTVSAGGSEVGVVTSGTFSFTLGYAIGTASIDPDLSPETPLAVEVRGGPAPAERVPLPFYRRPKGA